MKDRRRIIRGKVDAGRDEPIVARRDRRQKRLTVDRIAESKAHEHGRHGVDLRAIEIGFRATDAPLVHQVQRPVGALGPGGGAAEIARRREVVGLNRDRPRLVDPSGSAVSTWTTNCWRVLPKGFARSSRTVK